MVSDFLGMKGLDFLRVPVLSVMSKGLELQEPRNDGKLVQALASLGAQYARLGYSGKAGTALAKSQGILEAVDVPTEAMLQWHLAYAEYMLVLGNLDKCGETLSAARALAENDPTVSAMTQPTASFSTRLRYNKLLSEASHVYSLLSLSSGYPSEALAYAKQCVNLNRKIWLTVENRKPRSDVSKTASSDSELDDVTNGVAKMAVQKNTAPAAMSMTHGALTGAAFWSFVPSIFRGLSQLASVFAHQGMLQEAVYFSEQASKVAAAVGAESFVVQNFSNTAQYYLESNRLDDASDCLAKADPSVSKLPSSIDLALYHTTSAQLRQLLEEDDEAVEKYDQANSIIQNLSDPVFIQSLEKLSSVAPVAKKGAKGRKAAKEDFSALLKQARDCIAEVQSQAVHTSSTSAVQRVCSMLNEVTIFLSATIPKGVKGSLHPLYAAYLTELPKTNASQLEQVAISIEHQTVNRETLMTWPGLSDDQQRPAQLTASEFQTDYVNIIPQGWTAVSLSLNEARDELYITRYVPYQSPFILRLPMARHNSRDMDEEIFGFEEGKAELQEIIELSNFSTRNTPDLSKKGAKTEWWAEREALDARLGDLLANIENIWLGGFRGIFKKKGDRALLSRFQKSFENILDRHLPSRQGKGKKAKTTQLDSRILELFVGLGNPDDGVDLDEPLMDLVYFVVDILQFNGERNAYDEIDFDSIIIEMLDALRSFHEAVESTPNQHTILVLDKNLHAFPWESLPSLQTLSISRLPSMSALRERLEAARASRHSSPGEEDTEAHYGGHHIPISSLTGTSILNPGGDLKRTQETLAPHLQNTQGTWHHLIGRTPEEKTFESSLATKDVLLYFGHGSGAQYIRGRTVKKLLCQTRPSTIPSPSPSPSPGDDLISDGEAAVLDEKKTLATSLLFGCSSAHVTDNGAFEPSGMLCAYLTAGVPAVLGMLWDVTDKDCDRFAVATLQRWGLFEQEEEEVAVPKTPARSRGGGRAKTPSKSRSRSRAKKEGAREVETGGKVGLDEAVARSRRACYLRYLNGAAAVVYGIPVFLE
ncbi:Peptidase C50 [Neofusicoccum parvum]|uniref:Peptidase C50 n=1 Tax=Neofusicoccum parvum TaxID=310453 RepID=A0ACB5RWB5_9PEZI|nr:Peptidase C50 [Neofusicoccum parvum]